MPEHLKALIVVMGLAIPVLVLSKQALCDNGYDEDTFKRHRIMWVLVTLITFFSHSFWIYIVLCIVMSAIAATKERTPLALFLVVLFAAPHFTLLIRGFGPIQNLFDINHIRALTLAILLPIGIKLFRRDSEEKPGLHGADIALLLLLLLMTLKQIVNESITMTIRQCFYLGTDIGLPYYVASRSLTKLSQFKEIASALVLATAIISLIAVFESAWGWMLYESLRLPLGIPVEYTAYIARNDGGALRAMASTTHPIILGYVVTVGLAMFAYIAPGLNPAWKRWVAGLCLAAGLIAALSRGPWVGAMAMTLMMVVMGPGKARPLTLALFLGGLPFIGLLMTPLGQSLIEYLPFVGSVAEENVDYRFRLLDISMVVLAQNPIFGDIYFMSNPALEEMRQGQGIIDIVNSYLQIALPFGLVGLALFLAVLILPMRDVWRTRKFILASDPDAERLGRTLLACMTGILVTIATASSLGSIATLYWVMAGLCVSYCRILTPAKRTVMHPQMAGSVNG